QNFLQSPSNHADPNPSIQNSISQFEDKPEIPPGKTFEKLSWQLRERDLPGIDSARCRCVVKRPTRVTLVWSVLYAPSLLGKTRFLFTGKPLITGIFRSALRFSMS